MDIIFAVAVILALALLIGYLLGDRYLQVLEARTPAGIERAKQKGLTDQLAEIRFMNVASHDKALKALTRIREDPIDEDEVNLRAAVRETKRAGR